MVRIQLDQEIKEQVIKNGYLELIESIVEGELHEVAIKTSYGWETLFCGNGEAHIIVDVGGVDYEFNYSVDKIGFNTYLV